MLDVTSITQYLHRPRLFGGAKPLLKVSKNTSNPRQFYNPSIVNHDLILLHLPFSKKK